VTAHVVTTRTKVDGHFVQQPQVQALPGDGSPVTATTLSPAISWARAIAAATPSLQPVEQPADGVVLLGDVSVQRHVRLRLHHAHEVPSKECWDR
jgi:hypothetical protein